MLVVVYEGCRSGVLSPSWLIYAAQINCARRKYVMLEAKLCEMRYNEMKIGEIPIL